MAIFEVATGSEVRVSVEPLHEGDLSRLTKKRYFFDWKKVWGTAAIYKLVLAGEEDIKGVIALVDFPQEQRIEIKLLTVSLENVTLKKKENKQKEFEGIAGNLLAFAARNAVTKYGAKACISLVPKTLLKSHYMNEYGMLDAGLSLYLEYKPLHELIKKYRL